MQRFGFVLIRKAIVFLHATFHTQTVVLHYIDNN